VLEVIDPATGLPVGQVPPAARPRHRRPSRRRRRPCPHGSG
jgi:hypothetical protein